MLVPRNVIAYVVISFELRFGSVEFKSVVIIKYALHVRGLNHVSLKYPSVRPAACVSMLRYFNTLI